MALAKRVVLFVVCVGYFLVVAGQPLEVETGPLAMGDDLVAVVSNIIILKQSS